MAFNTSISNLTGTSTFYDWYQKENNEIISKLNLAQISSITGGDGILVGLSASSGLATLSIGGTSGNIAAGLTFSGLISFLGETVFPNISYKITGVTTGTSGYTFGSVVRITSTGYTLAKANGADSAEVVGVISSMNPSYSVVSLSGKIDGNFTTVAGGTLSPGCVYFLDGQTAGFLTTTEPTTIGYVSKPVMIGIGETAGMIVQYRGNFLNATSSGSGLSGSNIIYVAFPKSPDPTLLGFTLGTFLSYAPHVAGASASVNGATFFNQVLADTGRTALNKGWFISGSKNFISRLYTPGTPFYNLPWEDDFVVGMIQGMVTTGSAFVYEIATKGYSTVVPLGVSSRNPNDGIYYLAGTTYTVAALGVTGQLTLGATSSNSAYQPVYQLGRNFINGVPRPSNFYVDIRPLMNSPITSSHRSTAVPETLTNGSNTTYNGDFSIWQRDAGNKSGAYTTYGDVYFADGWIRRQSGFVSTTTSSQNLQKQTFAKTDTSVEGTPTNYIDIKCLEDLASTLSTTTSNPVYSIGHVVDGINTFSNTAITVSFYAKTAVYDNNYKVNVYFARYGNGALVEKNIIGQITPQSNWTKHTLNYNVPAYTDATSYSNDYVEIGLDLNPLIRTAYTSAIPSGNNVTISVASMCVYPGSFTAPPHMFMTTTEKLKIAQKYYYTTYSDSQTVGSQTMSSPSEPELNTYSFTILPNAQFSVFKLPTKMRANPTVTVYSPYSGNANEMFNYTFGNDLRNAAGSRGYNGSVRTAPLGTQTTSASSDNPATNVRLNVNSGAVFYDVVNCNVVVDSSYPI